MGGVTTNILTKAAHGILVYPKMPQFLGMGAFLGAFVGLLLGYIVEVADRSFRKPEPYKGKGVRYVGEYVRIKEGKKK